jgi:choline dehydrogenase-like flavoprotein
MRIARALMPALVMATGYLPGRFSDNSLTLEDDGADGRLIIQGRHAPRTEVLLNRGFHLLGKQVRRLGGWRLPFATQRLEPGSDAHTGATLAMGSKGPAATDEMGRVVGLGGLYVADGASLPRLSARHPTLTIMANADRIGRALARRIVSKPEVTARG